MSRSDRIRVLVVDDHPIYLRGLVSCLEAYPDLECVGAGSSSEEAIELLRHLIPDVVVLDATLPDTDVPSLVRTILDLRPRVRLLALDYSVAEDLVVPLIRAGIDGYLLRDCQGDELAEAIRAVAHGKSYLTPAAASRIVQQLRMNGESRRHADAPKGGLTEREMAILELLSQGKSNRQIATVFGLSERTVENHIRNMYRKLGVHDRTQAVIVAMEKGYLQLFAVNS